MIPYFSIAEMWIEMQLKTLGIPEDKIAVSASAVVCELEKHMNIPDLEKGSEDLKKMGWSTYQIEDHMLKLTKILWHHGKHEYLKGLG